MLTVTDLASQELQTAFAGEQSKGHHLVIYFQGAG
jgi:hypothetical protein